jgi:S1-C subfamily serine protease
MFNLAGEVVGVVSYILSQSGGFEGLGFAVSSRVAEKLLISTNSFWTGVEGFLLTGELAKALNVPQPAGILIQRVAEKSPGAALGLKAGTVLTTIQDQKLLLGGDIVLEIGTIKVAEEPGIEDRVDQYLRSLGSGQALSVKVLRGGSIVTLTAARSR